MPAVSAGKDKIYYTLLVGHPAPILEWGEERRVAGSIQHDFDVVIFQMETVEDN